MTDPTWLDTFIGEIDDHRAETPSTPGTPIKDSPDHADDAKWFSTAWDALPERQREILRRRAEGETLEQIGSDLAISRERVRQLQNKAQDALARTTARHGRGLLARLALTLADSPAKQLDDLAEHLPPAPPAARTALLHTLGLSHPRTWDGELAGWWTRSPDELHRRLTTVADLAPLSNADMTAALNDVGLGDLQVVEALLNSPNSKLNHHDLGWYRSARAGRDLAFLYLQNEGAPRTVSDIAAVTATSEHAIRETMRREAAFAQVRPEGTWALTDWRVPGSENRYSSAEETVVEVIRELGPITLAELRQEVMKRYPVSAWRINQCLSSALVGLASDGRYDLAERGAKPIEDTEPRRPATIEAQGHIVGVRLDVNHDLLRGSGIPVNRWLTWHLGLRIVPSLRVFDLDAGGQVTVKRASSNAQLSSLRTAVQNLDVVEGCTITLILNTISNTAKIHHTCDPALCAAAP